MRNYLSLSLVFLFLWTEVYAATKTTKPKDPVIIQSASWRSASAAIPQGSLAGGTTLYLKASGLSTTVANNAVFVGSYPCIVPENGVSGLSIICVTTAAKPDDHSLGSLPIVIKVAGSADSTCTAASYCYFTYLQSLTSQLNYLTPRVNYIGQLSFWRGSFLVSAAQSVQLSFDNQICDMSQSSQTSINSSDDLISCIVPTDGVAGVYKVMATTVNGNQLNALSQSQQYVSSTDTYQSILLPVITGLSTNILSKSGGRLDIYGLGFGYGTCQVRVYVGGQLQSKNAAVIGNDGATISVKFFNITLNGQEVYADGSGLRYTRWYSNTVYQNNTIGEPDVQNVYGTNFNEQFKGFFKAPITGQYRFYVASDDRATVELNTIPWSVDNTQLSVIAQNNLSGYRNYWSSQYASTPVKSISDYIDLEEGEYYQLRINHTNGGGPGYVTVAVEIENDVVTEYSLGALYKFTTSYDAIEEQVEYLIYNKIQNTVLVGVYQIVFSSTLAPAFTYTTGQLSIVATASQVASAINGLGYSVTVTSFKVDYLGIDLDDQTLVIYAGFRYVITFHQYRTVQVRPSFIFNVTANANAAVGKSTQILVVPATPIQGTFQLSFDDDTGVEQYLKYGTSVDLSFDSSASVIASVISSATGYTPLVWTDGTPLNGFMWYVQLKGVQQLTNLRVADNSLLSGNGEVTFAITTLQEASSNTLYEPIPNELLFTYSKTPTVAITLNGLMSACAIEGACNLSAPITLTLTTLSFTYDEQFTLTVLVTKLGSTSTTPLTEDLTTITFGDYDCGDITITNTDYPEFEFTCTITESNFEYGQYIPIFHYEGYGNSDVDPSVQPYQAPLTITSITPISGSEDGGTIITLTGKGFPSEINNDLAIKLGGVDVTISSSSRNEIIIKTPTYADTMLASVIILIYKDGITQNADFNYDHTIHITITQVQETILTPIYKGFNTIIGSGFGTMASDITVQLINADKTYDCPIVSVTDDTIIVYLRGGLPGEYRFSVNRAGVGEATAVGDANKFQYNTVITSIENAVGSDAGGTRIKIIGFNFVPQETIIFIGDEINWICDLDEAVSSSTELYCTTPPKHIVYTTPQLVIVTTRILFDSICQGDCLFTYDSSQTLECGAPSDATVSLGARLLTDEQRALPDYQKYVKSPKFAEEKEKKRGIDHRQHYNTNPRRDLSFWNEYILDKSKVYAVDQTETIMCSTATTQEVQITFNDAYSVTATILETGELSYTVPDLPQGEYSTKIVTSTGYASAMWTTDIEMKITSVSTTNVIQGGQDIEIEGTGFGDNNNIVVYIGTYQCLRLQRIGNRKLKCRTPRITSNGSYGIKILYDDVRKNSQIRSNCTFSTNVVVTNVGQPTITSISNNIGLVYVSSKSAYTFNQSADSINFDIVGTNLAATSLSVHLEKNNMDDIIGTIVASTATKISVQFANVPLGQFTVIVQCDDKIAYWNTWQYQLILFQNPTLTGSLPTASLKGGRHLEIHGHGFNENHKVKVCGKPCNIVSATYDTITCSVPDFNPTWAKDKQTGLKQKHYRLDHEDFIITSDVTDQNILSRFYDELETTYHYSNSNNATGCWVQVDFGKSRKMKIEHLSFLPRIDAAATYLQGAKFQYSTDGVTFVDWFAIDGDVHNGWNVQRPKKCEKSQERNEHGGRDIDDEPNNYNVNNDFDHIRAIKFIDPRGTSGSKCQLADIDFRGWLENDSDDETNISCDADLLVDGTKMGSVSSSVTYDQSTTPIVSSVLPKDVSPNTSTLITINGSGFVSGSTRVLIDEVECIVQSVTSTQITCQSGVKDVTTSSVTGQFVVTVDGDQAIVNDQVIYGQRWSDITTWGGYVFPGDGDSVMVYQGATLIVDVHTPKLVQVLVEGNLVFADDSDTSLDAQYVIIRQGKLQIGTQDVPHKHKVMITIRGDEFGIQYPNMGNKLIGCHQCTIDIHGQPRIPSWTLLASTSNEAIISVDDAVNWLIGDQVVVTSSGYDQSETEVRTIISISDDKKTLILDASLSHTHESVKQYYDGVQFPKQVEVGCLTRNIQITGDESNYHGVHIFIQGSQEEGTEVRIENVEITNGGQQRYLNRFPINFNNNGVLSNSYIRGNSIHRSNARCIGLQSVSYLEVSDNICHEIMGHAIYLQNGNEIYNNIVHNLVTVVHSSWQLYQSDATVSAFWITNPKNTFAGNRVGGSEWYGFYFALKSNPTGAASTADVCPTGASVLSFTNNAAHSTGRMGLRIGTLIPRSLPCTTYRNDALANPFSANPSVQSVLQGFTTWANAQIGVLAENLGNVLIQDFLIADSKYAGYQQHKANFSQEGTTIKNFVIVGTSTTGLIVPRTNGFLADTVRFANFPNSTTLIESCSQCSNYLVWVTGGKNTHFKGIKVLNSPDARLIHWNNFRREIFWDLDGSLSGIVTGAQIVAYKLHLDGLEGCTYRNTAQWDNSLVCDTSKTSIRDMVFNYPTPYDQHVNQALKIYRVPTLNAVLPSQISQYQYEQYVGIWSGDIAYSYASQFALGYTYNINLYNNWLSMSFMASDYLTDQDPGLVFRFNYTAQRETFDVYRNKNYKLVSNYSQISAAPDPNTCNNGDWYNDRTASYFYLCISGKQRVYQETVSVFGIFCRETCPTYTDSSVKVQKKWSDVTIWPNTRLPLAGENVTIESQYIVIIDIDTPEFDTILILGELWFDTGKSVTTLRAKKIFVRNGRLVAGSETQSFAGLINIILTGSEQDDELLINNDIEGGNNVLAVTGGLELYGKAPSTKVAYLIGNVIAGETSIVVSSTTDWQVGDWIVITPTGANPDEAEKVQITQITGTTVSFGTGLKYNHNGIQTNPRVDTRAQVLHLSRNIKITSGNAWGCRVLVSAFTEGTILRRGYVQLQGVEFDNCGQVNKENAGLDIQYAIGGDPTPDSDIIGCSFHDSQGYLLNIQFSENINIQSNVFYNGQKALVQVVNSPQIKFQFNTLVLVQKRVISINSAITGTYNWAVLGSFRYSSGSKITKNNILVTNNVGIGSTDTGFHIMTTSCDDEANAGFYNNYCYNTVQACFDLIQSNTKCNVVRSLYSYNSGVGIMASIYSESTKLSDFQVIEADRGVVIKPGSSNNNNNVIYVQNGYVSAVSEGLRCSNTVAFQLVSVSSNAYPGLARSSINADIINSIERMDTRAYIDNVEFAGYRLTYDSYPQCSNNAVFRQNIYALDVVGQHYLTNTQCTDCQFDALLYNLNNPNYNKLGWYGGCGQMICIGQINFLVEDQTGQFFGQQGQAIGNNTYFGPSTTFCGRQEHWNGFWCPSINAGVLNFLSTAPDQNTRLFSPTSLSGSGFYNLLNAFAEWNWDGPEPQNSRESKFVGLIQLNTTINMTNRGENPTNSDYWLSKRTAIGPNNEWAIIQLQFNVPNIVQVSADGKIVQPGLTRINQHMNLLQYTNVCGSNNYFYENRTIHFVVTAGCKVSLSLKNTLMISTRLEITTTEFFGDKFLQYAFALLGGDPYNYFIVGTYKSKRRFLSEFIDIQWAVIDNADIGTPEAANSQTNLESIASNLQSFNPVELGTVISNTAEIQTISTLNYPSTEQPSNSVITPNGSDEGQYDNEPVNQVDEQYLDPSENDDLLQQNDYVGDSSDESSDAITQVNNTKTSGLKQPKSGDDNGHILLISVICAVGGVVLLSLIISGVMWNRKQNVLKTRVHQQSSPDIFSKPEQVDDDIVQYNI